MRFLYNLAIFVMGVFDGVVIEFQAFHFDGSALILKFLCIRLLLYDWLLSENEKQVFNINLCLLNFP